MTATNKTAHLNCFDHEVLADFSLGRLPLAELERIGAELETCPTCQATLDTLAELEDSVVADLRSGASQVGAPIWPELEDQIREAEQLGRVVYGERQPDAPHELIPARLGQYEIQEQIGRGGMGTVYRGRHLRLKRPVAIKVLPGDRMRNPGAVARFQRETEAVGRLDHPNLVRAYDAGEADGQHFLVMEFLDGTDLTRLVRQSGPLPVADACEVIRQAALGLQHAHEHGLVHRDVKPSNLMLTVVGTVKVLDLGLARLVEDAPTGEMTGIGQFVGTGDFIAPEQAEDTRQADARSDIYSLGCTLYFLLAGRAPFSGPAHDTFVRKVMAHSREAMPPIRTIRGDVPMAVAAVLEKMLAKQPVERFQTAAEVADALAQFSAVADLGSLLPDGHRKSIQGRIDHTRVRRQEDTPVSSRGNQLRWRGIGGGLILALVVLLTLFAGPAIVNRLRSEGYTATAIADPPSVKNEDMVMVAQAGPAKREANEDSGSEAAARYLGRTDLGQPEREAMLTVVRQHPGETRWSGRSGRNLFAIAVKPLPREKARPSATPALLSLTHMLAVQELLKAKSLLDRYAESGLTDPTTLRQAVVQAAGKLEVTGKARGVQHQATTQDGFAVACVLADESSLSAHLLQPVELALVRAAYRDVMHNQARELMKLSNWKDALLLWHHLHRHKLVSPELYLDAARCFKALDQDRDAVRVLAEAINTLGATAGPEFLEQAGDLALAIQTAEGQTLAEQAYQSASERLREQISQPGARVRDNED